MAASAVGGAFLSGFANVVLERLLSPEVANLIRGKKLNQDLVDTLKNALFAVQVVLNDAELKQINDPSVQDWLFELRDAFYVADDLLDRLFTQAATHKEHAHFPESGGDSNMEKIGRDIVKKCRGLPLAAETLGDLPKQLPALETLEIKECEQLVSSLLLGPAFRNLKIQDSNSVGLQEFPMLKSLQSLDIKGCQLVKSMVGIITSTQPTCLQFLEISSCSCVLSFSVTSFLLDGFPNLKSLTLGGCRGLQTLTVSLLHLKLFALGYLEIYSCPDFEGFPTKGLVAPNLTTLFLNNCPVLKSLPSRMNTLLPKLHRLEITRCPQIDAFPEGGLPPNLEILRIEECGNLLRSLSLIGFSASASLPSLTTVVPL
ncbi:hypothetical protein RJT34_03641 [Clitoria ternatea]|uniref:Disease resistance N-terminal domain-containing protein n=1 Tax=Clitoria ternatea TaxID=43366 RepID=A0AAN9Q1X8_CLITE